MKRWNIAYEKEKKPVVSATGQTTIIYGACFVEEEIAKSEHTQTQNNLQSWTSQREKVHFL